MAWSKEDKAAETQDRQILLKNQDVIIKLQREALVGLSDFRKESKEQNAALQGQVQSGCLQLMKVLQGNQQDFQGLLKQYFDDVQQQLIALKQDKPQIQHPIDRHLQIPYHELVIHEATEKGTFGTTYRGAWENTPVSVKVIGQQLNDKDYQRFIREVKIMSRLRHPNITQLYGACLEPQACLVMEYMGQKSLYYVLGQRKFNPEAQKQIALDIARGLYYLHQRKMLHRDLKSPNVLLNDKNEAKLTDFGLAKTNTQSIMSIHETSHTYQWMAPETLMRDAAHTRAADIYSYGIVLWELLTAKRPFANIHPDNLYQYIRSGEQEILPRRTPEPIQHIIQGCWQQNPGNRLTLPPIIETLETYQPQHSLNPETLCEKGQAYEARKDYKRAYQAYQQAADEGYFRAQTNVALYHAKGMGGAPKNLDTAKTLWFKSAQQGHPRAQVNLAQLLLKDSTNPENKAQALYWFQRAAAKGDKDAHTKAEKIAAEGIEPQPPTAQATNPTAESVNVSAEKDANIFSSHLQIIPEGQLKAGKQLGAGNFGAVFRGKWIRTEVAIKELHNKELSAELIEEFKREADIMAKLNNPRVVRLYGICLDSPYRMVMEYIKGCSLQTWLTENSQANWEKKIAIALDITEGLAYIHGVNILHRDLKPDNVLMDADDRATLVDFGLAKLKEGNKETLINVNPDIMGATRWLTVSFR